MVKRPIRVLDLRDSPWVDGPGRTILQTASMVDPERCTIVIGAFNGDSHGDNAYLQEAKSRKLDVCPITEQSAFDRKVIDQINEAIRRLSIDVIHTHDFRSDIFGLWCARRNKLPVISTCHGWIANNIKGKIYTSVDRYALRYFDKIIAVSGAIENKLIGSGIKTEKISTIPNALIIDNYKPDKNNQSFRQELNIDPKHSLIANIGRLSPEKGQEIFLRAARELLEYDEKLCFILIGIGPQQEYLENIVNDLGIKSHVRFAGYRDDMINVYNSLDLVVQSSSTEGMPNVILESLLMEVPVVATDVGGTSEVVQDGFSGKLIDSDDLNQLVSGIKDWIDNKQSYQTKASRGRQYVSDNFDHNQRVARIMDIYDSVLNSR